MAEKYIKDHNTQEIVYPITKSECIIDAHSINEHEIDLLFEESEDYESIVESGMNYLSYAGLKLYNKKVTEAFEQDALVTSAALNTLNLNLASKESDILLLLAQVLELQNLISTLIGHYNELENIIG